MSSPATAQQLDPACPSPAEILAQLDTLLATRMLRESHQLQAFLEFIVRESLAGRQDGLKEHVLGCEVFGRKPDYDPRHDGIVRVQATTLRKRLERYYAEEGCTARVVIELPRGGYVPSFSYRIAAPEPLPLEPVVEVPDQPRRRGSPLAAFLAGALVTALLCAIAWRLQPAPVAGYRMTAAQPTDFQQLWGAFFEPGVRNLVGFGVPMFYHADGFYVRDVRINAQGQESQQQVLDLQKTLNLTLTPTDNTYTGVGEAVGTNLIASFLASGGAPVRVANARAIADSDLKGQNLVLVSSLRFQTLLQDLKLPSDFEFMATKPETIRNPRPAPGEKGEYVFTTGAGVSTSYALISLWPGVTPGRRILAIGGVHTWATQAATEFALAPAHLRRMSQEFARDRQTSARGPDSPFFQILLKVEGRGDQSQSVEYVTHHYLPK